MVILCVLDDLEDFLDSAIDLAALTTNEDDILGCVADVSAKLDRECLLLANDTNHATHSRCEEISTPSKLLAPINRGRKIV